MSTTLDAGRRPRMDPRIARRRVEVRREEGRRRLRILVACSSAAAVVSLLVGSLWTPLFKVRHVLVSVDPGSSRTAAAGTVSDSEVVAAAGLAKQHLMIDVDAAATARRLDSVPALGSAHVSVDWPGTVRITVVERRPVAQLAVGGPAGSVPRWAVVDATGRVLSVTTAAQPGLPAVYGTGGVPRAGDWIAGTAGPSASPSAGTGPAGGFADMDAQSDSTDVPSGMAAALAIAASLPADIRGDVQSITVGATPAGLTMAVLPVRVAAGSIQVVLGDGSQLDAKLTALETLLTQADLNAVEAIDLSVPDRPAALTAR